MRAEFGACSVALVPGPWQSGGMTIEPFAPEDRSLLATLAAAEPNAKQRDRYRAVALAMGGLAGDDVAARVGRSPRFVDAWAARYRAGGVEALRPPKRPGPRPKLTPAQAERLRARLDAGPTPADGVCALRGKDICRIVAAELGVTHTLGGIYDVLKRLGFSSLLPRPRHRKNDPAAMAAFRARAPFLPGSWPRPTPASGSAGSPRTRPGSASRAR